MSNNEELQKKCFQKLKPLADRLHELASKISRANSKTVANTLNELLSLLESIKHPDSILTATNTLCVLMPLLQIYKSMTVEERHGFEIVIEPWLKILHFLLSKTIINTWMTPPFTVQLVILFSTFLSESRPETEKLQTINVPKTSEEIKLLAVDCLAAALPSKYKVGRFDTIVESPYYQLTRALQEDSFIPIASQCIMSLLNTIRFEQNIELRVKSIFVLSQLLHDNLQKVDILAQLMPGVVSKLCATISQKAENENHQITCAALDALAELIVAVMRDDRNDTITKMQSFEDIFHAQKDKEDQKEKEEIRTKEWYSKTKESLANVLSQVFHLRVYPDWRSRLAFVNFSYSILSMCSNTLDNCVKSLVEILVLHIDDTYDEVANTCRLRMQLLATSTSFESVIMPTMKINLYDWMMKFPQYIVSRDEQQKANMMTLISGFIILLGKKSDSVLSNVLSRTSDSYMSALEIDRDSLSILEQKESQRFIELNADDNLAIPVYPKIRFKNVINDLTVAKLNRLLNVIGQYGDLQSWINHYMRYIINENSVFNDPQAAFIVYGLLSGAFHDPNSSFDMNDWIYDMNLDGKHDDHLRIITSQLLNDIMSVLTRTAMNNEKQLTVVSTSMLQPDEELGYVLTVCFCLQIVGLVSCILPQDYLEEQFITMLYPLLTHLGSNNVFIHTYALITLDTIAVKCGLANAQELAINNIDYIINMISQRMSILTSNLRLPLVLKALIHVGGYATISYLDDTIDEIFDAMERYSLNEWICDQLCGVLLEIIQALEKNTCIKAAPNEPELKRTSQVEISSEIESFIEAYQEGSEYQTEDIKSMEEIGMYFLERQKKGLHDDLTLEQTLKNNSNEDGNGPDEQTKEMDEMAEEMNNHGEIPLTHEQEMAKNIMDKASYFLTASSPQLRSHVLTILTSGITIFADHPDKLNQLIYNMWQPIVNRFDDQQNYVILQTANLIERISKVSTDFLSDKFTKNLWPRFKVILQKGIYAAISDVSATGYSKYSVYHRTQKSLLETLTHVAYHVPLRQDLIKDIVKESRFYYKNTEVHEELSATCQGLFTALATQQPDTIWLYCLMEDNITFTAPSDLLDPIDVPEWYFEKPQNSIAIHHPTNKLIRSI